MTHSRLWSGHKRSVSSSSPKTGHVNLFSSSNLPFACRPQHLVTSLLFTRLTPNRSGLPGGSLSPHLGSRFRCSSPSPQSLAPPLSWHLPTPIVTACFHRFLSSRCTETRSLGRPCVPSVQHSVRHRVGSRNGDPLRARDGPSPNPLRKPRPPAGYSPRARPLTFAFAGQSNPVGVLGSGLPGAQLRGRQ